MAPGHSTAGSTASSEYCDPRLLPLFVSSKACMYVDIHIYICTCRSRYTKIDVDVFGAHVYKQ